MRKREVNYYTQIHLILFNGINGILYGICVFALFQSVWLLVVSAGIIIIIIFLIFNFIFTVRLVCILCVLWHMDPCGLNQINK